VFLFLAVILLPVYAFSQALSQSPYGRYGLGDVLPPASALLQSLGGVSQVFSDSNSLNPLQPASLTSLSAGITLFEAGIIGLSTRYQTNKQELIGRTTGFGYFAIAFPLIRKKWNAGIVLTPLSNVGYTLKDTLFGTPDGQINFAYKGKGGFSSFAFSQGVQLSKDIALGLSVRYLFGKTDYSSEVTFPDSTNVRRALTTSSNRINDVDFVFGFTAQHRFKKLGSRKQNGDITAESRKRYSERDSVHLKFGATFTPAVHANASNSYLGEAILGGLPADTILFKDKAPGRITTPMQVGAGIQLKNCYNRWLFTADFVYTDWSGFRMFERVDSVHSSYKVSAGIQILPRPEEKYQGKTSYLKRIRYRVGGYYSDGYLRLYGENVPEMGLSFGIGLPIKTATYTRRPATSLLNLSITAGQRGDSRKNLLTEQFIRLSVSFSLNDRWFSKSKFE